MRADINMRTPTEWLRTQKFEGYTITSPFGWTEGENPRPFSDKIHLREFMSRLMNSEYQVRRNERNR